MTFLNFHSVKLIFLISILDVCTDTKVRIKCYRCQVVPQILKVDNKALNTPMCSKFDESEDYQVECPYSTMCVKKILKYYLQNGDAVDTITRGCASQKHTDQVFRQGNWQAEHKVEEPYIEGCKEFKENSFSASVTTYCYCRGNLCNSAKKRDSLNGFVATLIATKLSFFAKRWLTKN